MTVEDAARLTVGEVMLARPKTLAADSSVATVRVAFGRPTVRTVLLADGERFIGATERTMPRTRRPRVTTSRRTLSWRRPGCR